MANDESDDGLKSFRIKERRRAEIRSADAAEANPSTSSVTNGTDTRGFPTIEKCLESEDLDGIIARLKPTYQALEQLHESKERRTKLAAKRGMAGLERVLDLFEYLFETKTALIHAMDHNRNENQK